MLTMNAQTLLSVTSRRFRAAFAAIAAAFAILLVPLLATAQDGPDTDADVVEYDYAADTDPSALRDFREPLAPYGAWIDDPVHGTVWVPDVVVVGKDFAPYRTNGRWAVTDDGDWLWVSDYDWGHIPFHYGRWVWTSSRGWAWIPGRVYAPAWVVWRVGEPGYDYVGWAPMAPTYYWHGGTAVGYVGAVTLPFWFVPSYWVFDPYWHHHVVPHHRVHVIARHTHIHHHHYHHHHLRRGHRSAHAHGSVAARPAHKKANATASPHGKARARKSGGSPKVSALARRPGSPSFADARIPKNRIPKARAQHNPRALAHANTSDRRADRAASRATRANRSALRGSVASGRSAASRASSRNAASRNAATRRADRPAPRRASRSLGRTDPAYSRTPARRGSRNSVIPSQPRNRAARKTPFNPGRSATPPSRSRTRGVTPPSRSRSRSATPPTRRRSRSVTPPTRRRSRSATPPTRRRSRSATPPTRRRSRSATPPSRSQTRRATPPSRAKTKKRSRSRSRSRKKSAR